MILNLIPAVKELQLLGGTLKKRAVYCKATCCDHRLVKALEKLPVEPEGIPVEIVLCGDSGESYELWITVDSIRIEAAGAAGAFYAIQTLRQIFAHPQIPCLHIKDQPDFAYRGFYHDVTRGKVPTVDTIKELIDRMAYYKLNALQLYVEHVFEFDECKELIQSTGYLTKEEIRELDKYCTTNFISFEPSLSTFGHMYEILQQKQYQHLRVLKDYQEDPHFWQERMRHHTIDPLHPDSFPMVTSLIDQYMPLFTSDIFNICCDETFDLKAYADQGLDEGKIYVDFVKKIADYVKQKGKRVMMWGDILLKHPERIDDIPDDTYLLNWCYRADPAEEDVIRFAQSGRPQIVCPGTTTWNRFCENVEVEEKNISAMADYGHRHGALGMLNTNWGDRGHTCSLELAMYGMVLGAAKSWTAETQTGDTLDDAVNFHLYNNSKGMQYLRELSRLQEQVFWIPFTFLYHADRYGTNDDPLKRIPFTGSITEFQKDYGSFVEKLSGEQDFDKEFRDEMLIAAEAVCIMAELVSSRKGIKVDRVTDTRQWLRKFREKWLQKNKEGELRNIEDMFLYCEENW